MKNSCLIAFVVERFACLPACDCGHCWTSSFDWKNDLSYRGCVKLKYHCRWWWPSLQDCCCSLDHFYYYCYRLSSSLPCAKMCSCCAYHLCHLYVCAASGQIATSFDTVFYLTFAAERKPSLAFVLAWLEAFLLLCIVSFAVLSFRLYDLINY